MLRAHAGDDFAELEGYALRVLPFESIHEASRPMAAPRESETENAVKIAKYLNGEYRANLQLLRFGCDDGVTHSFFDSDRGGCLKTHKPTSGGVLPIGQVTTKHWSMTQSLRRRAGLARASKDGHARSEAKLRSTVARN